MGLRFHCCLFLSAKELFSWTYLLKKTPQKTEILIALVWNKILKIWDTLFELIQIEVPCCKNYFNFLFFLPQEAGTFGNNIEKELQKPCLKLKKICILYIYRKYLLCLQSNASGSFFQKCVNFVEPRFKVSHFEGVIPWWFFPSISTIKIN